jgi:hypothetical protein
MFCFDILIPEFKICHFDWNISDLGFRCCIETCIVGIYKCKDTGFDELTTHFGSTPVDIPSKHEVCPISLHSALRQCLPSLHLSRGQRYRVRVSMCTHSVPIRILVGYRSCAEFRQNKRVREVLIGTRVKATNRLVSDQSGVFGVVPCHSNLSAVGNSPNLSATVSLHIQSNFTTST